MILENYDGLMLALTIWREARGELPSAQTMVGLVILNRVKDKRWPNTIPAVVTQKAQFSCYNSDDPGSRKWPLPSQAASADWKAFISICMICDELLAGKPFDVWGVNHYYDISIPEPSWAKGHKPMIEIGRLRFYKL